MVTDPSWNCPEPVPGFTPSSALQFSRVGKRLQAIPLEERPVQDVWTPDGRIPPRVHLRLYLMVLLLRRFLLATNMLDLTTVLLGKTKLLRDACPGNLENRMDPN